MPSTLLSKLRTWYASLTFSSTNVAVTKGAATNGMSGLSAQDAKAMQNISKVVQGTTNGSVTNGSAAMVGKAAGADSHQRAFASES